LNHKFLALVFNAVTVDSSSTLFILFSSLSRAADNKCSIISAEAIEAEPLVVIFPSDYNFCIFKVDDICSLVELAHSVKKYCNVTFLITTLLTQRRQNDEIIVAISVAVTRS
jgi:hypothetical protein